MSKIKAEWEYKDKTFQIRDEKKEVKDKEVISMEDFIKNVVEHDRKFLISIRDGEIIKDPVSILRNTKENIERGELIGTKEAILKKFLVVREHLNEIEKIKAKILDNVYSSTIEACQALLTLHGCIILTPRLIPDYLKKLPGKIRRKISISDVSEIIKTYKDYEHEKEFPSGKKLDKLMMKAKKLKEDINEII